MDDIRLKSPIPLPFWIPRSQTIEISPKLAVWPRLSLDHADEDEAVARRFAELREQYEEVCLGLPYGIRRGWLTLLDVGW